MADDKRARFGAWWWGDHGPYSLRAEWPGNMTEAAWMAWEAQEEEIERLTKEKEEVIDAFNFSLWLDGEQCAAMKGEIERLKVKADDWQVMKDERDAAVYDLANITSDLNSDIYISQADNAKLRVALTELLAMCERQVDFNDDRDGLMLERARAALGGE